MILCILVSNSLKKDPRVIKQIRCAMENKIDVRFIGFRDNFYDKTFLDKVGCEISMVDLGDKYVGKLDSVIKKIYRFFMQYYLPIKMIRKIKPDVIHANDFDMLPSAFIASKFTKSKILYDSHEINSENIGTTNKFLKKNLIIIIERYLIRRVSAVVSVSNAAASYFKEKYSIQLPTVITNSPYKNREPLVENKSNAKFEVLYQGMMIAGRGYEEFVESAKYIDKDIELVLRGYGSIELKLRDMIQEQNLGKYIRFDGPVEIKDIVRKASESHVGIVLTRPVNLNFKYTVSNKIFEYMQAGLPVIISDLPEHRYLNEKFDFAIIIDEVTPQKIAKAINELSINTELYNKLRANAIAASELMCWENESKMLIEIYTRLAKVR